MGGIAVKVRKGEPIEHAWRRLERAKKHEFNEKEREMLKGEQAQQPHRRKSKKRKKT